MKSAIDGFSDTLRQELLGTNIHISLIEPGPILRQFRNNAYAASTKFINKDNGAHKKQYKSMLLQLNKEDTAVPFTLGPEAVLKNVIHAPESIRLSIRYYVTVPSYLPGYLKRFLPYRVMDMILIRAGGKR